MLKPFAALAFLLSATAALAGDIAIEDVYARSANPKSGGVFMHIVNAGEADRLIAAEGDVARKIELHTHVMEDGVAKMREIEGGIEIPAGGAVMLQRGGLHVMLMGIETPLADGDRFPLTLVFEKAGAVEIEVVVDNTREGPMMKHGN